MQDRFKGFDYGRLTAEETQEFVGLLLDELTEDQIVDVMLKLDVTLRAGVAGALVRSLEG